MVKFLQIKDYRAGGNAAMRIGLFRHRRAVLFYLFTTLFFFFYPINFAQLPRGEKV